MKRVIVVIFGLLALVVYVYGLLGSLADGVHA